MKSMPKQPLGLKLYLSPFGYIGLVIAALVVIIGSIGGTAVIIVEFFEELCDKTYSLSPRVWILIGVSFFFVYGLTTPLLISGPEYCSRPFTLLQLSISESLVNIFSRKAPDGVQDGVAEV
jgi:hypothetical protein